MDISFIEYIALVLIFGCIFIFVLDILFKKMVGVDNGFKELFGLYKAIKDIDIKKVVITLVSLVITILFIKLLNIKLTVINVFILFLVIKTLIEVIIYKKLPFDKHNWLFLLTFGFIIVWMYFAGYILGYLGVDSVNVVNVLVFLMPIILLLFIAVFVEF
ncbi:hypothetical protein ACO3UB_04215 [Methanocaldococcus sp. 16A]